MMYVKILFLVTFFVLCKTELNHYDTLGLCTSAVLRYKAPTFNFQDFINVGPFNYAYHTGLGDVQCASTEVHGDSEISYRGSATAITLDGTTLSYSYNVSTTTVKGVLDEVLTVLDDAGNLSTYEFKFIVRKWDKNLGVLFYYRCSPYGLSEIDNRAIIIHDCQSNDPASIKLANQWLKYDKSSNLRGTLKPVSQCNDNPDSDSKSKTLIV